ncbi:hypothetical protein CPTG_00101 [Cyanophage Syn2]|jgi:hypothetical protein|nr:hypothetical protein CPTG_00101 [Cyanophage Syn2]
MTKEEVEVRILKLKNELYDGSWHDKNGEWHDGAHTMLNRVLDIIQEYRL